MPDISYAILQDATTKLKNIHQDQIRIDISIEGAETDPLTLQQIRDEPSIRNCFRDRARNINLLLVQADEAVAKAGDSSAKNKILSELNNKVDAQVDAIEKGVQTRVNEYIQKQKAAATSIFWAGVRMKVKVLYSFAKLVGGGVMTGMKVVAAMSTGAGAFIAASAIKGVIDTLLEVAKLLGEFKEYREEEKQIRLKLKTAVGDIRKLKSPEKVPQSKIDAVQNLLTPYSVKLASVDASAKLLAGKLDALLVRLEKDKFRHHDNQEKAEQEVHAWILEIIDASKTMQKGKGLLTNAKDALKDASQRAQKDPLTFWSVATTLWKKFDMVLGVGEEFEKVGTNLEKAGQSALGLAQSLGTEYADAKIEEQLKK